MTNTTNTVTAANIGDVVTATIRGAIGAPDVIGRVMKMERSSGRWHVVIVDDAGQGWRALRDLVQVVEVCKVPVARTSRSTWVAVI